MLEDDHLEKPKYDTLLKSMVGVRVTNLSKVLLKQLSPDEILREAKTIICRQETDDRMVTTTILLKIANLITMCRGLLNTALIARMNQFHQS